jgi:hypothetical protein
MTTGILIIVAIALALLVLGLAGHWLVDRVYLRKSRQPEIFSRRRQPRGRVGRIR